MLSTIAPSLLLGQALAGAAIVGLLFFGGAVVVALIAAVWGVGVYNNLQRLRIGAEGAFGDIDVQLRRRHDLTRYEYTRVIRIVPGDKVKVELSPYDLNKGRITFRHIEGRPSPAPAQRRK